MALPHWNEVIYTSSSGHQSSARYSIWQEGTARKKDWFQQASKELNPQLIVQHILCLLIHTFYVYIYHSYKLDWAAEHPLKPIPWCGIWKFSTPDPNSHPEMRKGLRHWSFIGCTLQHSCKPLANHWKCWYHTVKYVKGAFFLQLFCHSEICSLHDFHFGVRREPLIHRRYPYCWDQGGLNLHYGIERTWKMVKWRLCPPALMPLLPWIFCSSCSSDPLRRLIAQHLVDLGSANALALLRYQVTNWLVTSAKRGDTDPHQGHNNAWVRMILPVDTMLLRSYAKMYQWAIQLC